MIRVILSAAANLDWPLTQLDMKNVILNGDLEEGTWSFLQDLMINSVRRCANLFMD